MLRPLAALLVLAAAPAPAPWLVGDWFGQGQPYDRSEMWLAHMKPNGEIQVQFRTCAKGKALDKYEGGWWSLSGNTETIRIVTVNGLIYPRTDTYTILTQNGRKQVYRYQRTGFVYTSSRVDGAFEMPSCEAVS